ncbi:MULTISPECIES: class I SAM-dependent methyltransferase [Gracilibacillus]|uniref:Methyltransferase domain-containing protein n=1 Tax=Gracilibacillus dipsosauri TaxID=178340 RepID=A0A317L2X7_9BACI|nr:class I SAM-dependent methyltransferase [Gracilibacillus dipsosauri]PWU69836.1 methyltransferase domain-containing protein [Gracilibacillus dipsosauri]
MEGKKHFMKKVEFLENPEKRGGILPEELLDMLPIQQTDTFLDLGAGTGYLTIPAAKRVKGSVFALDIDDQMLALIHSKAKKEHLTNIQTINSRIEDISLPSHSIDFSIASLVLHEIEPLSESLQQIKRVLKSGGYFVCVEFEKKDSPAPHHPRISSTMMEEKIRNTGLEVIERYPKEEIYIIVAQKP